MSLKRMKTQPRTAAGRADEQRVRDLLQNRPSVKSLIESGEIDPERITSVSTWNRCQSIELR